MQSLISYLLEIQKYCYIYSMPSLSIIQFKILFISVHYDFITSLLHCSYYCYFKVCFTSSLLLSCVQTHHQTHCTDCRGRGNGKAPAFSDNNCVVASDDAICFSHQNACFSHTCFYMPFLTMKMTESEKIALQYCINDFNKEKVD